MNRSLKIGLRILAVLLALVLIAFVSSWIYLKKHKKEVIAYIETEAKKGLHGGVIHIGDVNIGFGHTFPRIAFTIDTLIVRDSLWERHHHDLINANRAFASLNFFKLLVGEISIGRVELESPHIYIFTDSSGYENTAVFKKEKKSSGEGLKIQHYPVVEIADGLLTVEIQNMHKVFEFGIPELEADIHGGSSDSVMKMDVSMHTEVHKMIFDPHKGSYLRNKEVSGKFPIQFNADTKVLSFDSISLAVDQQPFKFSGKFFLAEVPAPFILYFQTDNLAFRKASSFLADNIQEKLQVYDISETITHVRGSLDNSEPQYLTPLIHIWLQVDDKTITTPAVALKNTSFFATFNNEEIRGMGHEDSNTVLHFTPLQASMEGLPLRSDSIVIRDLIHPRADLHLKSNFLLSDINGLVDRNSFLFQQGRGSLDFRYQGSLEPNYDSTRKFSGVFQMDSASVNYVPRDLVFNNGRGQIRFEEKNILIDSLYLTTGTTDMLLNGQIKSVFYLINKRNKKLSLDCAIRSNKINLGDFLTYLQPTYVKKAETKNKTGLARTIAQFTTILDTADFNLDLQAKALKYKKFNAANLSAQLQLTNNAVYLNKISLAHGKGSISMKGILRNQPASNPFSFQAKLKNIDISKIFYSFNSFGLTALTDKNIRGNLSADVALQGSFTQKAALIPQDMKGSVKFDLQNGELIDFEPLQKISNFLARDRDFSNIQFADLHDVLDISQEDITINKMEIRSTVLVMFVEGQFNMTNGPDLSIRIPLSNLGKINKDSALVNRGVHSKTGVTAVLRAQNGADGKLKISWDPFKKGGQKKNAVRPKS